MLVLLPASTQGMEKTKKEQISIGLISIHVLIVAFVSKFVLWLMPSSLKNEQIYKLLAKN
jgi:hypothetical protein